MSSSLEVKYGKERIENYVSEILTMELCKVFLPVSFIREDDEVMGIYKTDGFRRISVMQEIRTEDILSVLISLLHGVSDGEKHYIYFDEYEINVDTVFTDRSYSQTKMIYVPSKEEKPGPEKILELMEMLKEKGNKEGTGYLEDAIGFVKDNRFSYSTIIHHLEMLRKEVYLCGVE